jgi:hypothetical protein
LTVGPQQTTKGLKVRSASPSRVRKGARGGVVGGAGVGRGAHVLDVGTGALVVRLATPQCRVLGSTFPRRC